MGDALGQQIGIDNKLGGSGNIGSEIGTKAAPDGYTPTMATTPLMRPTDSDPGDAVRCIEGLRGDRPHHDGDACAGKVEIVKWAKVAKDSGAKAE